VKTVKAPKRNYLAWLGLLGLAGALGLLFFFAPDQYAFYPRCLFHSLTGLQCPGCGGLRAAHCLLHGEFGAAFHLNGLFVSLLPILVLIGVAAVVKLMTGWNGLEVFRRPFWLWVLLAVVVVFGIGRNLI